MKGEDGGGKREGLTERKPERKVKRDSLLVSPQSTYGRQTGRKEKQEKGKNEKKRRKRYVKLRCRLSECRTRRKRRKVRKGGQSLPKERED